VGPQGTLFGRNASAGLINIVSKRPSFSDEGYAEANYGNYDFIRLAAGVSGPIGETGLAYRVDGVYVKRDGFYRNVTQGGDSEGRVNDATAISCVGQLLYKPNDDLEVRLIGDYTRRNESCCGRSISRPPRRSTRPRTPVADRRRLHRRMVAVAPTNRIVEHPQPPVASRAMWPTQNNRRSLQSIDRLTPATYRNFTKGLWVCRARSTGTWGSARSPRSRPIASTRRRGGRRRL
jgi:outer membrane receptor protein involved in Fe transport